MTATVDDQWVEAACRADWVDASLFFPGRGESPEPAKSVCDGCGIKASCLASAMEWEARPGNLGAGRFGIWGGMTPEERKRLAVDQELRRRFGS